jgi:hypothetical protein
MILEMFMKKLINSILQSIMNSRRLNFFRKINREEPYVFKTLGNIEMKSGNRDKALSYYQQGLQIAIQNNEHRASGNIVQ